MAIHNNPTRIYRAPTNPALTPILRGRWYATHNNRIIASANTWQTLTNHLQHWANNQPPHPATPQQQYAAALTQLPRYNPNTKQFDQTPHQ